MKDTIVENVVEKVTPITWWSKIAAYFEGYPQWAVELVFSFVVAFVVGFILKNFGRYIFFIILTICIAGYVLNYFDLATFHFMQIKHIIGVENYPTFDFALKAFIAWARMNLPICVGTVLGFGLGWKVSN